MVATISMTLTGKREKVSSTMRKGHGTRLGFRGRNLIVALALMVPVAALGIASPALATPKGVYARFAQCPTEVPGVELCQYGETTSGEFAIGSTKVPINKTIILQGGALYSGTSNIFYLLPAKNGESLSKTELNVPGGLLDIVNCEEIKGNGLWEIVERATCKAIFENKTTGVTATTEIVANEHNPGILDLTNLFSEKETAITLPVRVHLKNPLLGESCYIGSESSPIQLHLTTGTTSPPAPNKPISGSRGELSTEEEVLVFNKNSLVDNAFSVPVAEGCGGFFSFLIDPVVDSKLGLPSAAGKNTAILTGSLRSVSAEAVVNSE